MIKEKENYVNEADGLVTNKVTDGITDGLKIENM